MEVRRALRIDLCLAGDALQRTVRPGSGQHVALFLAATDGMAPAVRVVAEAADLTRAWQVACERLLERVDGAREASWTLHVCHASQPAALARHDLPAALGMSPGTLPPLGIAWGTGFEQALLPHELEAAGLWAVEHGWAAPSAGRLQALVGPGDGEPPRVFRVVDDLVWNGGRGGASRGGDPMSFDAHAVFALVGLGAEFLARLAVRSGGWPWAYVPSRDAAEGFASPRGQAAAACALIDAWEIARDEGLEPALHQVMDGLDAAAVAGTLPALAASAAARARHALAANDRQAIAAARQRAGTLMRYADAHDGIRDETSGMAALAWLWLYACTYDAAWLRRARALVQGWPAAAIAGDPFWRGRALVELMRRDPECALADRAVAAARADLEGDADGGFAAAMVALALTREPSCRSQMFGGRPMHLGRFYRRLHEQAADVAARCCTPARAAYLPRPAQATGAFLDACRGQHVEIERMAAELSALVAYRRFLRNERTSASPPAWLQTVGPRTAGHRTAGWVRAATSGRWLDAPPAGWRCSGARALPADRGGRGQVLLLGAADAAGPTVLMCQEGSEPSRASYPRLVVADVPAALRAWARRARAAFGGQVVAVVGDAGGEVSETVAALLGMHGSVAQLACPPDGEAALASAITRLPADTDHWLVGLDAWCGEAALLAPHVIVFAGGNAAVPESLRESGARLVVRLRAGAARPSMPAASVLAYGSHAEADLQWLPPTRDAWLRARCFGRTVRLPCSGSCISAGQATLAALAVHQLLGRDPLRAMTALGTRRDQGVHCLPAAFGTHCTVVLDDPLDAGLPALAGTLMAFATSLCPQTQRVLVLADFGADASGWMAGARALRALVRAARVDRVYLCGAALEPLGAAFTNGDPPVHWHRGGEELCGALERSLREGDWLLVKGMASVALSALIGRLCARP